MLQLKCNVTLGILMNCLQCGIEFESKRETAKFCSPKCRVTHSRSVTLTSENVTLSEPDVTLNFEFRTPDKRSDSGFHETDDGKVIIRKAKYWYGVPLAAVPVIQEGWPELPEPMNGRQYFLWWKNEFRVNENLEKGEIGSPIIHNPFPKYDKLTYFQAAEGSRRWGA